MRKEMLQKEPMWFPWELSNKLGEQNVKDKNWTGGRTSKETRKTGAAAGWGRHVEG